MPNAVLAWDGAGLTFADTGNDVVHGALSVDAGLAVTGDLVANGTSHLVADVSADHNMSVLGQLAVGGPSYTSPSASLYVIQSPAVQGYSQWGIWAEPAFPSTATVGVVIEALLRTAVPNFALPYGYGLRVESPLTASGGWVTTLYGIYVGNQGIAADQQAYGIYIDGQWGGGPAIGLYNRDTSQLNGTVAIGGQAPQGNALLYVNGPVPYGASEYGVQVQPTIYSDASSGYGLFIQASTWATTWTLASLYGVNVGTPSLGSGSAVSTAYGLYVANQAGAGRTNAYGVYIANQAGAATTNLGLYNGGTSQFDGPVGLMAAPSWSPTGVEYALYCTPTFDTSVYGIGLYVKPSIPANHAPQQIVGLMVDAPTISAGASTGMVWGIYVAAMPAATSLFSYASVGIYVANGGVSRPGIYCAGAMYTSWLGVGANPSGAYSLIIGGDPVRYIPIGLPNAGVIDVSSGSPAAGQLIAAGAVWRPFIPAGQSAGIDNFSGMLFLDETATYGNPAIFMVGGTRTTLVAQGQTEWSNVAGAPNSINVYVDTANANVVTIQNNTANAIHVQLLAFRLRASQ